MGQTTLSKEVMEFVRVQAPVIALEHVRLIDGTGAPAQADQTIVISEGRLPPWAHRVSFHTRRRQTDGLHRVHGDSGNGRHARASVLSAVLSRQGPLSQYVDQLPPLYLAAGLTTHPHGRQHGALHRSRSQTGGGCGLAAGPKINATGPYLEGKNSRPIDLHHLTGPRTRAHGELLAEEGSESFKVYNFLSRAELKAVVDEAHRHHLKVTGHLCSIGFREAAEIGIDNLEHGITADTEFLTDKKPDECPNAGLPWPPRETFRQRPGDTGHDSRSGGTSRGRHFHPPGVRTACRRSS